MSGRMVCKEQTLEELVNLVMVSGDFDPLKSNDKEVEAAEVLEEHVFPCIGFFTQHIILLGDHIQLCPAIVE